MSSKSSAFAHDHFLLNPLLEQKHMEYGSLSVKSLFTENDTFIINLFTLQSALWNYFFLLNIIDEFVSVKWSCRKFEVSPFDNILNHPSLAFSLQQVWYHPVKMALSVLYIFFGNLKGNLDLMQNLINILSTCLSILLYVSSVTFTWLFESCLHVEKTVESHLGFRRSSRYDGLIPSSQTPSRTENYMVLTKT